MDVIGRQSIEPQAQALLTFIGDYLALSGYQLYTTSTTPTIVVSVDVDQDPPRSTANTFTQPI